MYNASPLICVSSAFLCTLAMFTFHSFWPTLPSEEAMQPRKQQLVPTDAEGFCQNIILQMVSVASSPIPATRRRPGPPPGTFDVHLEITVSIQSPPGNSSSHLVH